ncbi:baseplate J/gp47 family protein [Nitratireductor sp. B36]|uniref:baseplate J/gp47 family protein n=1 Tax=Nitratireductor sp. B36 TaxID=2762059 RepID=UPI001E4354B9|nr:baseplate J/gp47 family protein [Nitratireductor sp. B36]MCC5780751.1 baseplate J/gp47 family protein [Nitratireductor sp. B36]
MTTANPFSHLPPPEMIKALDVEAILTEVLADMKARFRAAGIPFDVENTAYEPAVIQGETNSFRENLLRAAINDAAKANLVAFSSGSDLDHVAAFYDVTRLADERDDALRLRTSLAIQARSPGGSSFWYAQAARRADVRIRDVAVFRDVFLPIIHVAVLSSEAGGVPDAAMLDAVSAEVQSDRVRLLNDTIVVQSAVSQTLPVKAGIWLLPSAPMATFDRLADELRAAWERETGIGFDLEPSWIEARLHVSGVKRVEIEVPSSPVVAAPGTAIALGDIDLTFMGRDY